MSDSSTLLIGFVAAGFLVWAIVMTVFWSREKNKKAATMAPGPSQSPCPPGGPAPAPDPQTVAGWSPAAANFMIFDTFTENPRINYTVKTCAEYAKSRGADAFTLRPSTHFKKPYANTCMGYALMTPGFTDTLIGPTDGITGCVNPSKKWPACGTSNAWCHKTDSASAPLMGYDPSTNISTPYVLDDVFGRNGPRATLKDLKTEWEKPGGKKSEGYKYVAVAIRSLNDDPTATVFDEANYRVHIQWGKTLPNMGTLYLDEGCNYGGTTASSTKYKVGRKPGSAVPTSPLDYHQDGTTWRIYDLSQIV